jgi:hypothetical protein
MQPTSARQDSSRDPAGADVGRRVPALAEARDLDHIAGMRRVHELTTANVDPLVAKPVEEDEVTRLRFASLRSSPGAAKFAVQPIDLLLDLPSLILLRRHRRGFANAGNAAASATKVLISTYSACPRRERKAAVPPPPGWAHRWGRYVTRRQPSNAAGQKQPRPVHGHDHRRAPRLSPRHPRSSRRPSSPCGRGVQRAREPSWESDL